MSWVAVAIAGAGVVAGGASIYGANKSAAALGEQGSTVVEMPQYSWTEPNMRLAGDQLADAYARLGEGKAPAYWEKALPDMISSMKDPLRQQYFGRPGERSTSIMGQTESIGSRSGVGQKGIMAAMNKRMLDYRDQEALIDKYFTGRTADLMQRQSEFLPQMIAAMPQGPQATVVNNRGGVGGMSGQYMGGVNQALSSMPWESMFSGNNYSPYQGSTTPYGTMRYSAGGTEMGYMVPTNATSASIPTPEGYSGSYTIPGVNPAY